METKFNFKSQPTTSIEQSKRLLSLGLKKETADCIHFHTKEKGWEILVLEEGDTAKHVEGFEIPAWSLGRLLELIKHSDICNYNDFGCIKLYIDLDDFETCITMISYMVKEEYFNKEYLYGTTEN